MALEGKEEGERWDRWTIRLLPPPPPLAGAAPHGLGGTVLAPQLQPLLCSLVYEINAPHLLFLLPGNHARQRIKPGGLLSPACFPPRDTWNVKHDELFPLGQATEQLLSAQLEPPTSSPELTWFLFPSHSPGSTPLLPNHWKNTAISFRSAEGEHLPAARLLLPCSLFGVPLGPQKPVTRLWRGLRAAAAPSTYPMPLGASGSTMLLCRRLGCSCLSPRLRGEGKEEAPPCREISAVAGQEKRLLPPGCPRGVWLRCYLCAAARSGVPRRPYKNKGLNVKPAAWSFGAVVGRRSNMSLNSSTVLTKILLLLSTRSKLCRDKARETLVCLYSPTRAGQPCPASCPSACFTSVFPSWGAERMQP